jgi:hypothetical protein
MMLLLKDEGLAEELFKAVPSWQNVFPFKVASQ